jgi:8-oxo-dGTP diphosphatase
MLNTNLTLNGTSINYLKDKQALHVSVDCVIFGYENNGLKVLLMESDMPEYSGKLSLVGDILHKEQTLRQSAEKILYDCTNLTNVYLEQVEAFSELDRHPVNRVITIAYYSLLNIAENKILDNKQRRLRWVPIDDIQEMAFDHKLILDKCYSILQKRVREYPIGFNLLPSKFSLKQLQQFYETVLGIEMDKRNFRRKLNSLDILIDLNENQDDVSHRPAKLYSFNHEKYNQLMNKDSFRFEI